MQADAGLWHGPDALHLRDDKVRLAAGEPGVSGETSRLPCLLSSGLSSAQQRIAHVDGLGRRLFCCGAGAKCFILVGALYFNG